MRRREYVSSVDHLFVKFFRQCVSHDGTSAKIRRKEGPFLNVWMSEFDFLLVEAPLPRLLKKTKQTVSTGHFNITHFPVELKAAIHPGTQTRSN